MWILKIHVPGNESLEYIIKPGKNSIGRDATNDIAIDKSSVSRQHARIDYSHSKENLLLRDLGSTNGTFVNDRQVNSPLYLQHQDIIGVGNAKLEVYEHTTEESPQLTEGTHPFTKELLLYSLDVHAILLYEVSERLNTIFNLDEALTEVANLTQKYLGADRCKIILKNQFDKLPELGFPTTQARTTINQKSATLKFKNKKITRDSAMLLQVHAALCAPVITNDEVIALIYMYKTNPTAHPFTQADLQITTAISHQAALTIQRVNLINQFQKEQNLRQMFQRFISPQELDYFINVYQKEEEIPGLMEKNISVLFLDIADSTRLAENAGAKIFGDLLRRYYEIATDIIFQNRGIVRYFGDGILAVFGAMNEDTKHESRATKTGLGLLEKFSLLTEEFEHPINLGIGVNTGQAMVGYVGPQERLEFTALGDVVNIAHSFQFHSRPNRLLVGKNTFQAIEEKCQAQKLQPIKVKGRDKTVEVYEITEWLD